jgi:hypothetical protein
MCQKEIIPTVEITFFLRPSFYCCKSILADILVDILTGLGDITPRNRSAQRQIGFYLSDVREAA